MIEDLLIMVLFFAVLILFMVATHQANKIHDLKRQLSWTETSYNRLLAKLRALQLRD